MSPEELERAKLRYLLYDAIMELEYVQCAEDHSQCASAKGRQIIERGMELLGVTDFSFENLSQREAAAAHMKECNERGWEP